MASGFIYFQDLSTPTGSRLYGGSLIQAWCTRISVSQQTSVSPNLKPNQVFEIISSDSSNLGSMWNRRKNHIQVSAIDQMNISISGGWKTDDVGSHNTDKSVMFLSPYKLKRMNESGHTFYLKGGTLLQWLIDGERNESVGSYYTGSGIPIIITSWNSDDASDESEYVSWGISAVEDKDTIFLTN